MRLSMPAWPVPPCRVVLAALLCGLPAVPVTGESPGPPPPRGNEGGDPEAGAVEPVEHPEAVEGSPEGWLEAHGISAELVSKADVLSRVRGGLSRSHAPRYRGHLDLVTTFDTGKLGLWSGGTVVLVAQNGHGRGVSEGDVGDVQALSNIDAHSFTQMSEWFLEQTLAGERLRVKVGRQDAAVDFGLVDFGAEFLNSSFGVIPTNPLPTFPDPAVGLSAFVDVTSEISVGAGLYSSTAVRWGPIRGTTLGVEVAYAPSRGDAGAATKYRAGFWHQRDPLQGDSPATSSFYVAVDLVLLRGDGGEQRLSGFLQLGTSTGAPNGVDGYVGAGLVYIGPFPGRDEDRLGLGVAHARLPAWAGAGPAETDVELLYRVSPWTWLTLQPSLHWVLRPSGQGRDALVAGLRIETRF